MITTHLSDLTILACWLVIVATAFLGWGRFVGGLLGQSVVKPLTQRNQALEIVCGIWIGLCFCVFLVEVLHFFVAISWQVSVAVLGLGILNAIKHDRSKLIYAYLTMPRPSGSAFVMKAPLVVALLIALFIWMSAVMIGPANYDSGLYHFASIKWLNEQSITYGLVNLHTRLAYNQSYFALIALLNFHPYFNQGYAGAGLFLFLLTVLTSCLVISQLRSQRYILYIGSLTLLSTAILGASSPNPDLAVGLFQTAIFFISLQILVNPIGRGRASPNLSDDLKYTNALLATPFLLCLIAVLTKLSMAAFCLAMIATVGRYIYQTWRLNRLFFVKLILLGSTILFAHFLRGYALSGWPLYPSSLGGWFDFSYAPSLNRVAAEANIIYGWARIPGVAPHIVLSNWDWLGPWWAQLPVRFVVLMACAIALFILNLAALCLGRASKYAAPAYWLYAPLWIGVIFWFFTAPDVRFLALIPELLVILGAWLTFENLYDSVLQHLKSHWRFYRIGGVVIALLLIMTGIIATTYRLTYHASLGLGKYLYIHDVLFWVSQIGMNVYFLLVVISGAIVLRYTTKKSASIGTQYFSTRDFLLNLIFAIALALYIANAAMFNLSGLRGWMPVPVEPYDSNRLRSGLIVNVPKSNDLCWQTPLPCLPRQQFNQNLELTVDAPAVDWLPTIRVFKLKP